MRGIWEVRCEGVGRAVAGWACTHSIAASGQKDVIWLSLVLQVWLLWGQPVLARTGRQLRRHVPETIHALRALTAKMSGKKNSSK